jgi:hypothetical protein
MKKLLLLATILSCPLLLRAQGVPYHDFAWYNAQTAIRAIPSAQVSVCIGSVVVIPCTSYASIFSDIGLTQAITQPGFAADLNGNFAFFAAPGTYVVNIAGVGFTSYGYVISLGGTGGGGGGSVTLQTNGVNNALQSVLNQVTSTINSCGVIITPNNLLGGNVSHEASGLLNAGCGGSGRSAPTANSVLLGEGTNPFNVVTPGALGTCLVSNGPGVDPSFQTCSLSSVVPTNFGGTGVASPTAHTVPVAEGAANFTFISPGTAGWCLLSNGTGADPGFGVCPSVAAGGPSFATQYNNAGALAGLASPTANGVYQILYNIVAGAAAAPTTALPGVIPNPQTGTSYTYGAAFVNADRFGLTTFSNASAIAVTLPQAGTVGFTSNWGNLSCNLGAGLVTITPTTSTISYYTGNTYTLGASSMPLSTGWCAWIFSDNSNYFAVVHGFIADVQTTVANSTVVPANSCSTSATTVVMYGVTGNSAFAFTPTADTSGITGWGGSGGLTIDAWPTTNTLNYKVCNQTSSSITTSAAVTFNVSAR